MLRDTSVTNTSATSTLSAARAEEAKHRIAGSNQPTCRMLVASPDSCERPRYWAAPEASSQRKSASSDPSLSAGKITIDSPKRCDGSTPPPRDRSRNPDAPGSGSSTPHGEPNGVQVAWP